jgi:N-glycosylase/DNA lyase
MNKKITLKAPDRFSFKHTIYSHGWCDLLPFAVDTDSWQLRYVFRCKSTGKCSLAAIRSAGGKITITLDDGDIDLNGVRRDVRRMLRLDDDLGTFYELAAKDEDLSWITSLNAGRLLRSPTVFEDLVKTICTTNCSWALTKIMVANLVEKLGSEASDGSKSFPTPEAMAAVSPDFYRDEIRAGYRSEYLAELALAVASGRLDPEQWLEPEMPTAELKAEIKTIKGAGDYAAETMLKLLGRYDGLALDSWLRSQFYKKHKNGRKCPDRAIDRHYRKFGAWKGLAIWCDMTERWVDQP